MVRNSEKKLGSTVSKYKTFVKMVEKALDPQNPTMERSLAQNRANVQDTFIELCYDHEVYQSEVLEDSTN